MAIHAVRVAADAQLKKIYERANGPGEHIEVLTNRNPLGVRDALGTEISGLPLRGLPHPHRWLRLDTSR